jgi:hypothetical protein
MSSRSVVGTAVQAVGVVGNGRYTPDSGPPGMQVSVAGAAIHSIGRRYTEWQVHPRQWSSGHADEGAAVNMVVRSDNECACECV